MPTPKPSNAPKPQDFSLRGVFPTLLVLTLIAVFIPKSTLDQIGQWFGTRDDQADIFDPEMARWARDLRACRCPPLGSAALDTKLSAALLVRRLQQAGPMTLEEINHAARISRDFLVMAEDSSTKTERQAVRKGLQKKLIQRFPRLNEQRLGPILENFALEMECLQNTCSLPRPNSMAPN